jgi:hypothetical protein
LDHLLLALALADWAGGLPLKVSSGLRAILDKVRQASTVETTIVVVFLVNWRKAQLLALLGLWCQWLIELSLLGYLATHLPG